MAFHVFWINRIYVLVTVTLVVRQSGCIYQGFFGKSTLILKEAFDAIELGTQMTERITNFLILKFENITRLFYFLSFEGDFRCWSSWSKSLDIRARATCRCPYLAKGGCWGFGWSHGRVSCWSGLQKESFADKTQLKFLVSYCGNGLISS